MLNSEIHLCKREPSTPLQLWLDPITIRESKSIVHYLYMYYLCRNRSDIIRTSIKCVLHSVCSNELTVLCIQLNLMFKQENMRVYCLTFKISPEGVHPFSKRI